MKKKNYKKESKCESDEREQKYKKKEKIECKGRQKKYQRVQERGGVIVEVIREK